MARTNTKKSVIFIKSGATLPVAPANFIEVTEPILINTTFGTEEFNRINGKLGAKDSYTDTCDATISQSVTMKMRSSNNAGLTLDTPPEYGELLKIGGFSETIDAVGKTVIYTNTQTPTRGSAIVFVDGNKHTMTDSVVADITMNFNIGKAAEISANLSAFIDDKGIATSVANPNVTLNSNPVLIVGCTDILLAGGTALKADSITITVGAEVSKFYGLSLKEFEMTDYAIKIEASFYPENADYNTHITKLANGTVEAIDIKLGTGTAGALVNGKSVQITAGLAKASSVSNADDQGSSKRTVSWILQGNSAGEIISIKHGKFL